MIIDVKIWLLAGLVWDEQRGRYFRIQPDVPGSSTGYSRSEMAWERREQERLALFSSNRDLSSTDDTSEHPPLASLIHQRQLGLSHSLQTKRRIGENRVKSAQSQPSYTAKVGIFSCVNWHIIQLSRNRCARIASLPLEPYD